MFFIRITLLFIGLNGVLSADSIEVNKVDELMHSNAHQQKPSLKIELEYENKIYGILELLFPQAEFYLFGSRKAGNQSTFSDIDLAINASYVISPWRLAEARNLLKALVMPYEVDLVDLSSLTYEHQNLIKKNETISDQFILRLTSLEKSIVLLEEYLGIYWENPKDKLKSIFLDGTLKRFEHAVERFSSFFRFYLKKIKAAHIEGYCDDLELIKRLRVNNIITCSEFEDLSNLFEDKYRVYYCHDIELAEKHIDRIAYYHNIIKNVLKRLI